MGHRKSVTLNWRLNHLRAYRFPLDDLSATWPSRWRWSATNIARKFGLRQELTGHFFRRMNADILPPRRADSSEGFDKGKLQNGVMEPLRESDLIE